MKIEKGVCKGCGELKIIHNKPGWWEDQLCEDCITEILTEND